MNEKGKKMRAERYFSIDTDGFYGAYYPLEGTDRAFIAMLGDDIDDLLAKTGVKWLQARGCSCLTMAPAKADYGHHNYPLERFEKAIAFLKEKGNRKIGIVGASTTGMLALIAASYYPDITMTLAFSPGDFVMEGFYRDGKDGAEERPGDGESTVSIHGEPLPYLPFAYRHPEYWQKIQEESKGSGNFISSIGLFNESEKRHPIREEEKIKVERIQGHIVFIGAEDDVLWDTCRYIRRMEERLSQKEHFCTYDALCYRYGTHFIFPESMLKKMLPIGSRLILGFMFRSAKEHPSECREARIDIDRKLRTILENW
jgi:hypothetical protein